MNNRIDQLVSLIFSIRKFTHEQVAQKNDKNFSYLQTITLKFIKEKSPQMSEISDFLAITPPSATSLVNSLVKSGMIKRKADQTDRRKVKIEISAKGEKHLKEIIDKTTERMKKNLAVLSEKDQKNLLEILSKIANSKK